MIKRIAAILGAFTCAFFATFGVITSARAEGEGAEINSYTFYDVEFTPLYICSNNEPEYQADFLAVYNNTFFVPTIPLLCDFQLVKNNEEYGLLINGDFNKKYATAYANGVLTYDNIYNGLLLQTHERNEETLDDWDFGYYSLDTYLPNRYNSYASGRGIVYGTNTTRKAAVCVYDFDIEEDFNFNNLTGVRVYNSVYEKPALFTYNIHTGNYVTHTVNGATNFYEVCFSNTSVVPYSYLCVEFQSFTATEEIACLRYWLPAAENISIDTYKPLRSTGEMYDLASYAAGYEKGGSVGYTNGYEAGYTQGVSNGLKDSTPVQFLGSIFQTLSTIFDFRIFGAVKVSTLVFIPVFLSLIFFILRIVRGG